MRVLLVHSDDDLASGPWTEVPWDRIVDMGVARRYSSQYSGADVEALPSLAESDFVSIREALAFGSGVLIDDHGLDWWDLSSIEIHQKLETLRALRRLAQTFSPLDDIAVTRSSLESRVLELLLGRQLNVLSAPQLFPNAFMRRTSKVFRFRPHQVIEILSDKYDGGYRFRRRISSSPSRTTPPIVLLPSAYVNVSRTALQYASAVPELDFLLVTTRRNAEVNDLPPNVQCARLASYAQAKCDSGEIRRLLHDWRDLNDQLTGNDDLAALGKLKLLPDIAASMQDRALVRDAWLKVFNSSTVNSVLCGDEMNPFTRLPVCIASKRGITTASFHHGAFDGRYRYRANAANVMLSKGPMEHDYLMDACKVPKQKLLIAPWPRAVNKQGGEAQGRRAVVFFSEPYEISSTRCRDVYAQVLPHLARIAALNGCELVLKLHAYESGRERRHFASKVFGSESFRVMEGPLTPDLLKRTWCAVTVASTAALDCALEGIPAFLCRWLDRSQFGYGAQFVKFGAALPLEGADDIALIPEMLRSFPVQNNAALWSEVDSSRLRQLLGTGPVLPGESEEPVERVWA